MLLLFSIIIVIFVLETFSNSLDLLIINRDLQNSYYPNLHHQACIGTWEKFVCACQPAVKGRAGRAEYRAGSTNWSFWFSCMKRRAKRKEKDSILSIVPFQFPFGECLGLWRITRSWLAHRESVERRLSVLFLHKSSVGSGTPQQESTTSVPQCS